MTVYSKPNPVQTINVARKSKEERVRKDIATKQEIEGLHEYQKEAHAEIMEKLVESNELNGQEVNKLTERVVHIEKQTGISHPGKN